jgi:hypothetical protein
VLQANQILQAAEMKERLPSAGLDAMGKVARHPLSDSAADAAQRERGRGVAGRRLESECPPGETGDAIEQSQALGRSTEDALLVRARERSLFEPLRIAQHFLSGALKRKRCADQRTVALRFRGPARATSRPQTQKNGDGDMGLESPWPLIRRLHEERLGSRVQGSAQMSRSSPPHREEPQVG